MQNLRAQAVGQGLLLDRPMPLAEASRRQGRPPTSLRAAEQAELGWSRLPRTSFPVETHLSLLVHRNKGAQKAHLPYLVVECLWTLAYDGMQVLL